MPWIRGGIVRRLRSESPVGVGFGFVNEGVMRIGPFWTVISAESAR